MIDFVFSSLFRSLSGNNIDTPKSLIPSKDDALASPGLLELRDRGHLCDLDNLEDLPTRNWRKVVGILAIIRYGPGPYDFAIDQQSLLAFRRIHPRLK